MSALNTLEFPFPKQTGILLEQFITVQAAAQESGYNAQYIRRLLRGRKLKAVKIGQVWLIQLASLEVYLKQTEKATDHRCGPRKPPMADLSTNVNTPCLQLFTDKKEGEKP
jgi:excisionase family DNA binding protein